MFLQIAEAFRQTRGIQIFPPGRQVAISPRRKLILTADVPSSTSSTTRHAVIAQCIRDELAVGHYGNSGRLPSEAQLVRRFGVSRPTAARALRTLVEAKLIERRAGSGTFVNPDCPKDAVASVGALALLIPGLDNNSIFNLISGEIAGLARVHHRSLIWGPSSQPKLENHLSLLQAEELCDQYIERRVSGVFFAPCDFAPDAEATNQRIATSLCEAGTAVVLLDRDIVAFPRRSGHDLVGIDHFAGGYFLAEHLLKLGCRSLGFVTKSLATPTIDARIAGVREALARHRIAHDRGWIHTGDTNDRTFVRGLVAARTVDALVCVNDYTAAALLRTLKQINIRVPQEVRVTGFDDLEFAAALSPALTTMQQPYREIAVAAFKSMADRQADPSLPPRRITISPRLVVRDSCGAYLPPA